LRAGLAGVEDSGMASLTARQRNALPRSAFVYPASRKYPVPTKAQARRAGISEGQRIAIHRSALSRAGQRKTMGSYGKVAAVVRKRSNVAATPRPVRRRAPAVRRSSSRRR
jgi:hypothetical protein